ncbi:MAG: metalloregulator ArsR/SmtB family transcription factor [Pararhodobacter sp.]
MILTVLSALAEPTRLAAVALLSDGGEHCVCELMKKLDASQSRMSRHMQTLKHAGLVVDRRDAQWVRYRLNPDMPPQVRALVDAALAACAAEINERKVA